jgi:hypothetical protein
MDTRRAAVRRAFARAESAAAAGDALQAAMNGGLDALGFGWPDALSDRRKKLCRKTNILTRRLI